MAKYISGKVKNLQVGITSYSEDKLSLNVVGIVSAASYHGKDINVSGVSTFSDDVVFIGGNSNARWDKSNSDLVLFNGTRLILGSNEDFQMWHGGSHTFIKNTGGDLRIRGDVIKLQREDSSETYLQANVNQDVKLFFNGNEKFATTNEGVIVSGILTATTGNFTGNVSIGGTLTYEDVTNIDSVGLITAREGIRIGAGKSLGVGTNSPLNDLDLHQNNGRQRFNQYGHYIARNFDVSDYWTFAPRSNGSLGLGYGTPDSNGLVSSSDDKVTISSTGNLTVTGNINANGNIVGDNSTNITGINDLEVANDLDVGGQIVGTNSNISGINSVTATTFYGDGSKLTGVSGGGIAGINTTGQSYFKDVDISGNLEVAGITTLGTYTHATRVYFGSGNSQFIDTTGGINLQTNTNRNITLMVNASGGSSGSIKLQKSSGSDSLVVHGHGGISIAGVTTFGDDVNVGAAITMYGATGIISATKYYGDGSALTGVSGGIAGINTAGQSYFKDVDVSGNLEVAGISTFQDIRVKGNKILLDHGGSMSGVTTIGSYYYDRLDIFSAIGRDLNPYQKDTYNLGWTGDFRWKALYVRDIKQSGGTSTFLGSVGIGTTNPSAVADTNNTTIINAGIVTAIKYYGDGSALTGISGGGTSDKIQEGNTYAEVVDSGSDGHFKVVTEGAEILHVASGTWPQVGIGTNNPQDSLHIRSGTPGIRLADGNLESRIKGDGGNLTFELHNSSTDFSVRTSVLDSSTIFMLKGNGKVGIGSVEPKAALDVVGVVSATSFYGDGSALTNVTASGSGVGVKRFNTTVGTAGTLNFGTGLSVTDVSAGIVTITGGQFTTDSEQNLYAGYEVALQSDANTCHNLALGYEAAYSLKGGDHNILLGYNAGYGNTTGAYNILMGAEAGKCLTGASYHVAIGYHAARNCNHSTTDGGVYIGYQAGKGASGNWDVLIGKNAGECASSGGAKIGLGACALRNDRGNYNIGVGFNAGSNLNGLLADRNIAIGCNVSFPKSDGECQLVIGHGTDLWLSGNNDFNVGIGTTNPNAAVGVGNTAKLSVGIVSAYQLYGDGSGLTGLSGWAPDAQNNLVAGTLAGSSLDNDTNNNIAIGYSAGTCINSGDSNILMGREAGVSLTSGSYNTFIGCWAGRCNTSGVCNIAIGREALKSHCGSGSQNIVLGTGVCAGSMITGDRNIVLGYGGGRFSSGNSNIALGSLTMMTTGFSTSTVAIGECAGNQMANTSNNIVIGKYSGRCIQFGCCNVYIGCGAGQGSCTTLTCNHGDKNIGIGIDALRDIRNANVNVAIGCHAGAELLCGGANVLIGAQAGCKITNGDSNTFLGTYAGKCAAGDYTSRNTFVGYNAGGSQASFTGRYNVAMGSYAGAGGGAGCNNVFIGKRAGCSGFGNSFSGNHVAIGKLAGCGLQGDSTDNIFLGCCTGHATCGGSMQIMIGRGVNAPILNGSHQFAIGIGNTAWLTGNSDFNVGIGTTNPDPAVGSGNTAKLSVGILSAYQLYGDGSNLTGVGGVSGVGTFNAAAGIAHTINQYTIASSSFETSEYTVYVGIGTKIQSQKALVMEYDGSAYYQEYGVMYNKDHIVSVGARVVSGVVRLELTPQVGVSGLTTYRFSRQTT